MIDILMATYNGTEFVSKQIESILSQTYKDFRLIISDDCSKDYTTDIIREFAKKDKRITFYRQEANIGVVRNFEFLLRQVTSEYFMFADQDDIWKENKIEKSIETLIENNSDMVYCDAEVIDGSGDLITSSYWEQKGFKRKIKKYNNYESLFLNNYITGCTMLVKSKFISQTNPCILPLPKGDKYMLHDYWTALIVSIQGKITPIYEPLIFYRQHENNQIGARTVSEEMDNIDDIRNLFIDVKFNRFKTYKMNAARLQKNSLSNLIDDGLLYYYKLSQIPKKGFKIKRADRKLFKKLYKYESFTYRLKNKMILHHPKRSELAYRIIYKRKK